MKFDDLDTKMRVYEQSLDQVLLPELYLVARLDGNRFTRLTKELCKFEAPFDERFRDMMVETVKALMSYGFRVIYGFTESDEISLLFHPEVNDFGRKVRKYNSLLAGVASASFSMQLGRQAIFDCRMVPLPTLERVQDYFLWRQEDAHRNSLNSHCYWMLRKQGKSAAEATEMLEGRSVAFKNELLFRNGINFNDVPNWQKRGVGIYWDTYLKEGFNPITGETVYAGRRALKVNSDLPIRDEYAGFIGKILQDKHVEQYSLYTESDEPAHMVTMEKGKLDLLNERLSPEHKTFATPEPVDDEWSPDQLRLFIENKYGYKMEDDDDFILASFSISEILSYYCAKHDDPEVIEYKRYVEEALRRYQQGVDDDSFAFSIELRSGDELRYFSFSLSGEELQISDEGSVYSPEVGGDSFTNWSFSLRQNGEREGMLSLDVDIIKELIDCGAELVVEV